jgi:hypothetical protein
MAQPAATGLSLNATWPAVLVNLFICPLVIITTQFPFIGSLFTGSLTQRYYMLNNNFVLKLDALSTTVVSHYQNATTFLERP